MRKSGISDKAIHKATGKSRKQWFAILDKAGAKTMKHVDIARLLNDKYMGDSGINVAKSGGWWSQMVTVEYERERGLRTVNQYADGFLVAVHKTVPGSIATLRRKWSALLKSPAVTAKKLVHVPSKTKRAMLRYKAPVGGVVVMFDERANGKTRIMVESTKLPRKGDVEPARKFWKKILEAI